MLVIVVKKQASLFQWLLFTRLFNVSAASAPTNLMVVQEGLASVRVSWTPPTPLGDTTGYRVDFISSGNDTGSVNVSDRSSGHYVLHGLIREATYYISIVATSEHLPSHSLNSQVTLGT